ncbi:MAG TPA: single-stranded-DNA-specific exonuclease RecJ, partial [Sphingorhabdus sp.]|nr:single-stranded-DNA-specific exonuclease RecJ [Sphingorhabdus sp.]
CDIVGKDHVRAIVAGDDGASFKAMAFRQGESALGQQLLHGERGRKYWLAGRAKTDDWGATLKAELHIDDIAFAD